MKKYLIVSLLSILVLCGCSSSLTCTLNTSEEDYEVQQKIVFNSDKNDKVEKAEINYTMIFEDETTATDYYNIFESLDEDYNIEQDKNKITIKSEKDYSGYDQTKDTLKEELENNGYTCK